MRRLTGAGGWVLGVGLVLAARPALALITAPLPLGQVLNDSPLILTARVDMLDPARPAAALVVDETLKGKAPFTRLAQRYIDRVILRATPDRTVRVRMLEVLHLLRPPQALVAPRIAFAVLRPQPAPHPRPVAARPAEEV